MHSHTMQYINSVCVCVCMTANKAVLSVLNVSMFLEKKEMSMRRRIIKKVIIRIQFKMG